MDENNNLLTPQSIIELSTSYRNSRILLTAIEFNLFTKLNGKLKTSKEIADLLLTDQNATDRFLNALCALGFLRKVKDKFYNTNESSQYLVKGKPNYLGTLEHNVFLWKSWNTLTDAVKEGKSVIIRNKENKDWTEAFIAAMHSRAKKQAGIIPYLIDLSNTGTVLDVGGGSGIFSMGLVKAKEGLIATVFDLPDVIPLTEKYIKNEGLENRIKTIAGNYLVDDFPGKFDLIFLSAIIHSNSPEDNLSLIKKCTESLNRNGQLVIKDFIMNENRIEPENGALFALNMLVNTMAGDTYTEKEVTGWMIESGLSKITRKNTSFDSSLIIGYNSESNIS